MPWKNADPERDKKAFALAGSIMELSRSSLLVNFPFLSRAMSRVSFTRSDKVSLASDGRFVYYDPWYILTLYKAEQSAVTRDLLHTLLHCVFRHGFVGKDMDRARWNLSCDVAVEYAINDMERSAVSSSRVRGEMALISVIRSELGGITAERVYKWLGDRGFTEEDMEREREPFMGDNHGVWYGGEGDESIDGDDIDLWEIWEDVSRRMQTELEIIEDRDNALTQELRIINRQKQDYREFLRRFGMRGEVMRLSEEEFDNNYYCYGLEMYGNIPLIEPLEYSEDNRIKELVIAIDTSGSVKGELVQSFIQRSYDILSTRESFFDTVELHVIQCDDRIREDAVIRNETDFRLFMDGLEIKGLGKTDFRPVFNYVAKLRKKGELKKLQGLLYFTDGKGVFPESDPGYDTAFVICADDFYEPEVPSWAMQIRLREDEIIGRM